MKVKLVLFLLIGVIIISNSNVLAQYYYNDGQQIPLIIDSSRVCIKFESIIAPHDQPNILSSLTRFVEVLNDKYAIDGFVVCSLSNRENIEIYFDSVRNVDGILLTELYYHTESGVPFVVGDRFSVAFDISLSQNSIDSLNGQLGTETEYEFSGMPNVFVLRNTASSGKRMLDIANYYDELSYTQFAHPIVAIRIVPHSYMLYDFYNAFQPHTKKVIGTFNVAAVWDFAGLTQPVTVAVLDNGVEDHVDLPSTRIQPGRNFVNSSLGPEPVNAEYHGMACAGIIAASHTTDSTAGLDTSSGVISVAPSTIILPVKIFSIFTPVVVADSVANAINYAWQSGAEVLSNSWGTGIFCPLGIPIITSAISNAFFNGRNGKGCPVIFSSGNQSASLIEYPSCISQTFSVGAITLNDARWYYSNYGLGLDVVAPSGDINRQGDVWTIDQMAKEGANHPGGVFTCQPGHPIDGNFYCSFGGTSAAAPIVSGVAALLISKDSNLTAQEVYDILRFSAVTELDSDTITPPDTAYGYGRVDAFRSILSISRGDLNNDNAIATVLDLTYLIDIIYRGGPDPFPSPLMGDCNCDGTANNIVDLTFLVDFIFRGSGIPPVNPCFEF